jgi:fucose 4-O-acetylase-like acetyltransferase
MQRERIHWIDIAKGIGIIFIIYAHVLGSHDFRHLFYSFHIPLFFFLSGIVYNPQKYISFPVFLKKSVRGLLLPYFIFAFIFFILWLIRIQPDNLFSPEIIRQFLSIFYANSNNGLMAFNNILWFLPTLFATRLLFVSIFRFFRKPKVIIFILMFFSVFGYLFSIFASNIKLPFGIETALSAVVFYGAGFLWNQSEKAKILVFKYKYYLFLPLLIIGAYISNVEFNAYGVQIDMRLSHLNNYFSFYTAAFCGIFTWISFSKILNKNSLLEKIGRNTLILFVWHPFVFIYLPVILKAIFGSSILRNIKLFIPLAYTIVSITLILFANSVYNKFVKKLS